VLLLLISGDIILGILRKIVEDMSILLHGPIPLSQLEKFFPLDSDNTSRNMMGSKNLAEFIPSDLMTSSNLSLVTFPPYSRGITELMSRESNFLLIITWK